MNHVAIRMLVGDRLRYIALVAGLTFAVMLITQQASIMNGFMSRMASFIRDTVPTEQTRELWVMDPQRRFSHDVKPISDTALSRVRGIDGVEWAVPMYLNWIPCRLPDGTVIQAIVIGLDDATLTGGPPEMVEGKLENLRQDGAIIVDADEQDDKMKMLRGGGRGVRVGDRLTMNDHDAVVVGSFRASKGFFWEPTVYTTFSRAVKFAPQVRQATSFVLAKVKDGADVAAVQASIAKEVRLKAMTSREFQDASVGYMAGATGIKANFGLAIALGFVIGLLVSAQTLYQFTQDNLRNFAALKAMGASDLRLVGMVSLQVLVVGSIGYGLGLGIASVMGVVITAAGLASQMTWGIPLVAGVAILAICLLAGVLSILRVLRLEPAVVFKS